MNARSIAGLLKAGGNRGGSAVEFALILTFILAPLTVAVIDFGQILHADYVITRAAREGAMASIKGLNPQSAVDAYLTDAGLDPAFSTVTAQNAGGARGTAAIVQVTYDYADMVVIPWPHITDVVPSPLVAKAEARN